MKTFYTYLHCKPDGTPFYVGKGTDRKKYHDRSHAICKDRNNHHRNIVNKYGKDRILIYVFICETEEQAIKDEIQQIAQLRNAGYDLCNMTDGGDGIKGLKHTEEAKLRISKARVGKKLSEETKAKMSAWHKGKIVSAETRKRLSESVKQYWKCKEVK